MTPAHQQPPARCEHAECGRLGDGLGLRRFLNNGEIGEIDDAVLIGVAEQEGGGVTGPQAVIETDMFRPFQVIVTVGIAILINIASGITEYAKGWGVKVPGCNESANFNRKNKHLQVIHRTHERIAVAVARIDTNGEWRATRTVPTKSKVGGPAVNPELTAIACGEDREV